MRTVGKILVRRTCITIGGKCLNVRPFKRNDRFLALFNDAEWRARAEAGGNGLQAEPALL